MWCECDGDAVESYFAIVCEESDGFDDSIASSLGVSTKCSNDFWESDRGARGEKFL